jgi:hydrogenase maturation protease
MSILVLGLGNAVMGDDAFGGRVITELLRLYEVPAEVKIVDGGTLGLDLLPMLEDIERLLVVDALEMGGAPGEIFRLHGEEVPRAFAHKLSVHQMGLQDLLAVAELCGHLPPELVVWGVQPATIEPGMDLSPSVDAALSPVVVKVAEELAAWGSMLLPLSLKSGKSTN